MSTSDPTSTKRTFTTHDAVTEGVTVQAPRNKIGDRQIYGGTEFVFDGSKWVVLEKNNNQA